MKRPVVISAAILLLALLPGSALAVVFGVLDQSQTDVSQSVSGGGTFAQTFTAGKTGRLTNVELYMSSTSGDSLDASIEATASGVPTGSALATSSAVTPSSTAGWLNFAFASPANVTSGVQYAIVFDATSLGIATSNMFGSSSDTYAGGQALSHTVSWATIGSIGDWGFRTFVNTQSVALAWDKAQVVGGVSTPLTLTETFTFPAAPAVVGVQPDVPPPYAIEQVALPSWFTVTGLVCSSQVATADCIVANAAVNSILDVTPDGNPIVLTLSGTATPALADIGKNGTGTAEDCSYVVVDVAPAQLPGDCLQGSAEVAVVAAAATPPPTNSSDSSNGSSPTPFLALLICLVSGVLGLAAVQAQRRSIRR